MTCINRSLLTKVVEPCTICSLRNAGSLVTFVLIIQLELTMVRGEFYIMSNEWCYYESQFTLFGEAPAGTSRGLEMLSRARGTDCISIDWIAVKMMSLRSKDVIDFTPWRYDDLDNDKWDEVEGKKEKGRKNHSRNKIRSAKSIHKDATKCRPMRHMIWPEGSCGEGRKLTARWRYKRTEV